MAVGATRFFLRVVIAIGVIAGLATIALWQWQERLLHAPGTHNQDVLLLIEPGDGHVKIRWELKRAGLIAQLYHYDMARFLLSGSFLPKAGEFLIPAGASLEETLHIIDAGKSYQRRLTVVEGMRVEEVVDILVAVPVLTGELETLPDEGYVLPETYFFTHGTPRRQLLDRMVAKREMELHEAWVERAPGLPFSSAHEALILASIVELETGNSADRREVAGVFVNRLKRGMRLQSDPTVLYGVEGAAGRPISRADLNRQTAWNTYVISGLPKTAICNPSRDALSATLNPAITDNLYFVSDGIGGLLFAKTLDAHNRNVRLFRSRQKAAQPQG